MQITISKDYLKHVKSSIRKEAFQQLQVYRADQMSYLHADIGMSCIICSSISALNAFANSIARSNALLDISVPSCGTKTLC